MIDTDKVLADFFQLRDSHYEKLGVNWSIDLRRDGSAYFSCFQRRSDAPKGNGAKALKELLDIADKNSIPVELFAQDRSDNGRLVAYYRQFGFEKTDRDFHGYPVMVRTHH